jgi:hypothetical protein
VLTPLLVLLAALAVAAPVVAVAAPDPRHATLGAFAALLLSSLVSDPLPSGTALVARIVGALLGGWLVWMAVRAAPRSTARSALGWPGGAGVGAAAFAIGWLAASALGATLASHVGSAVPDVPGGVLAGGSLACRAGIAAAVAIAVLAAPSVVLPRDGLRLGLGVVLLVAAAGLASDALIAVPDDSLELALAVLVALLGATVAAVTATMLRSGGDLVLRDVLAREPAVRHRAADDAHPGAAR